MSSHSVWRRKQKCVGDMFISFISILLTGRSIRLWTMTIGCIDQYYPHLFFFKTPWSSKNLNRRTNKNIHYIDPHTFQLIDKHEIILTIIIVAFSIFLFFYCWERNRIHKSLDTSMVKWWSSWFVSSVFPISLLIDWLIDNMIIGT